MTTAPTPYTLEQLAPGSYDGLLDGTAMASLVRSVHAACEQQSLIERKQHS